MLVGQMLQTECTHYLIHSVHRKDFDWISRICYLWIVFACQINAMNYLLTCSIAKQIPAQHAFTIMWQNVRYNTKIVITFSALLRTKYNFFCFQINRKMVYIFLFLMIQLLSRFLYVHYMNLINSSTILLMSINANNNNIKYYI